MTWVRALFMPDRLGELPSIAEEMRDNLTQVGLDPDDAEWEIEFVPKHFGDVLPEHFEVTAIVEGMV